MTETTTTDDTAVLPVNAFRDRHCLETFLRSFLAVDACLSIASFSSEDWKSLTHFNEESETLLNRARFYEMFSDFRKTKCESRTQCCEKPKVPVASEFVCRRWMCNDCASHHISSRVFETCTQCSKRTFCNLCNRGSVCRYCVTQDHLYKVALQAGETYRAAYVAAPSIDKSLASLLLPKSLLARSCLRSKMVGDLSSLTCDRLLKEVCHSLGITDASGTRKVSHALSRFISNHSLFVYLAPDQAEKPLDNHGPYKYSACANCKDEVSYPWFRCMKFLCHRCETKHRGGVKTCSQCSKKFCSRCYPHQTNPIVCFKCMEQQ